MSVVENVPVVSVSAPSWAMFLFDCANNYTDSEGLVFGTRHFQKTDIVTDEAQGVEKLEENVRFEYAVTLGAAFSFYNWDFSIKSGVLQEFVHRYCQNGLDPIGWFRYQRGETVVENFSRLFKKVSENIRKEDVFEDVGSLPLCFYLTHEESDISETTFRVFAGDSLDSVQLQVINMGDTNDEISYWSGADKEFTRSGDWLQMSDFPLKIIENTRLVVEKATNELRGAAEALLEAEKLASTSTGPNGQSHDDWLANGIMQSDAKEASPPPHLLRDHLQMT